MIYLASASPRRQELLRQIGIRFSVMPADIPEQPHADELADRYVRRLANAKARHVAETVKARELQVYPVLGADTEVVIDGEVLGKPRDRTHGLAMLRRLAGRTHDVLTAIALVDQHDEYEALSRSRVTFAPLTDEEIEQYWASGEAADKAGGYAVQGLAARFIVHIEGSYSGIVGLPLFEVTQLLRRVIPR